MKVNYTGVHEVFPPNLQEKLDQKFAKISKLIERRGEREAHVVVTQERHLHNAEVRMNCHNHELIGLGSDTDLFTSLTIALDKLETQAAKLGAKFREKTRRNGPNKEVEAAGSF